MLLVILIARSSLRISSASVSLCANTHTHTHTHKSTRHMCFIHLPLCTCTRLTGCVGYPARFTSPICWFGGSSIISLRATRFSDLSTVFPLLHPLPLSLRRYRNAGRPIKLLHQRDRRGVCACV